MVEGPGTAEAEHDFDRVEFKWLDNWDRRRAARRRAVGQAATVPDNWIGPVGGLVVAVGLALWLTAGAWGGRPPFGEDTLPHLLRAEFALSHLLPHFRVDGWHPAFILGYEEFLFFGPAFTWAVGLVRALSLGFLSVPGAFKVVFIGTFVALPAAVAFFARSFGLSARGAALAAILTLAVNNPFGGVGLQGLFNVGLVPHQFAGIFFFLTLGGILRLIDRPNLRWTVFTGVTAAVLLLSHIISVILLVPLVAIVLAVHLVPLRSAEWRSERFAATVRREVRAELRRLQAEKGETAEAEKRTDGDADDEEIPPPPVPVLNLTPLLTSGVVAGALAACWLVPFLAHRNLRGGYTDWGTPPLGERLAQIWRGDILFRPGVAPIVLLGLAFGLYRAYEGRQYALAMVAAPIAYLVVSHAALHQWPGSIVSVQLPNRGLGYVGVLAILPLAALLDRIGGREVVGTVVAIGIAVAIVILPLGTYRDLARQSAEPIPQLRAAAAELARVVPDGARFVTERDFPGEIDRTKVVNPDRWLAWASGRNTLNNFNVESSTVGAPAYEAEHVRDRPPEALADAISRLGVTHLVTVSEAGARQVGASSRFNQVWAQPPIAIFKVVGQVGQPEPGALLTANIPVGARLTAAAPEALKIEFEASQTGRAAVAVAWSPKWHARLDGRPIPLFRGSDSLLELEMPAGSHRLELRFRQDIWDRFGLLVSALTVLGGAFWLLWLRRTRQPHGLEPRRAATGDLAGDTEVTATAAGSAGS